MILLDTNVLSELMKSEPHARVVAWVRKQSAMELGFADTSHLAHVFQRITGRPPSAYRRSPR